MVYVMARVQDLRNPETVSLAQCTIQDVSIDDHFVKFCEMLQDDLGNATS